MAIEGTQPEVTGEVAEAPRAEKPVRKVTPPKPARRRGIVVTDPVADLLTRVRNAVSARHESVSIPLSTIKVDIARILKAEGFISDYDKTDRDLTLKLKYASGKVPTVVGITRISRPGLRVYARKTKMPRVLGGLGIAIVSTSSGLMTGREAERRGLGGEILAHVW